METTDITTVDNRIIAAMRLVLALSALLITLIDPSEPDRLVALTYLALGLYALYSLALYSSAQRYAALQAAIGRWAHWADVGWYTLLIALSSGTSSIFFFFFFFAILVASFRHGYRAGLSVVGASVALFTVVGFLAAPAGPDFELNRFLLRPIYLGALGYMIAYWGGFELTLKRRLGLLKDVNTLANPRFGVDRTMSRLMEQVRRFFDADACVLIAESPGGGGHTMRRADRSDPERAVRAEATPPELAGRLLAFPTGLAVVYGHSRRWGRSRTAYHAYDVESHAHCCEGQPLAAALGAGFEAAALMSVPLRSIGGAGGRLYVTSSREGAFQASDLEFLLQVVAHFMPVVENIRLLDRLASDAAEVERQRIAHDLHDSVIQPYIGLQMGLTAIDRKLAAGETAVAADVRRLIAQIGKVIDGLRSYVRGLKSPGDEESVLLASMRRFVDTYTETTGIDVELEVAGDLQLTDRLAAEVFQMVAEGLSNIRRHTQAMRALVLLGRRANNLVLRIEDEGVDGPAPSSFTPHSIAERAAALGGRVLVGRRETGGSAVVVEIPL